MILNVYCVFDSAASVYQRPFYCQTDGEALRAFGDISFDKEHPIGMHPEDYSLYRVGQFNDAKGELVPLDRECLATALEVVSARRNVVDLEEVRDA